MRNLLVLIDGLADTPQPDLGGKTPLEAANTPILDKLGMAGRVGSLRTVPKGQPPETLAALFTILGYPPGPYLTGRGYYEALAAGIAIGEGEWAFRLQLVSERSGVLIDPRGSGIGDQEGRELLEALDAQTQHAHMRFIPGHRHNHLLVVEGTDFSGGATQSPFTAVNQHVEGLLPSGPGSEVLRKLMEDAATVLSRHEVNRARVQKKQNPANAIWPWSGGTAVAAPGFAKTFGLEATLISYSPLFRGVAVATGIKVVTPGGTPARLTDPSGRMHRVEPETPEKRATETEEIKRMLEAVRTSLPQAGLVIAHFTFPDDHSHQGDAAAKIKSIESIDRWFFKPLAKDLEKSSDVRLTVVPTLMSRVETRQHDERPVPFLMWGQGVENVEQLTFTEANAEGSRLKIEDGTRLIDFIMNGL